MAQKAESSIGVLRMRARAGNETGGVGPNMMAGKGARRHFEVRGVLKGISCVLDPCKPATSPLLFGFKALKLRFRALCMLCCMAQNSLSGVLVIDSESSR